MSRHGYHDDGPDSQEEQWALICYRGAVKSAIRGKRGQAFLRELIEALDALTEKKLCSNDLQRPDGSCCAIGAVGKARGIDMTEMDPEYATENGDLSEMFDIAQAMVREIEYENDDWFNSWYADNVYEEQEFEGRLGPYKKQVHVGKRTNSNGEQVDKNGRTLEQWQDREDRIRWSRMRQWATDNLRNPCPR